MTRSAIIVVGLAVAVASAIAAIWWLRNGTIPDGLTLVNGRIEGDPVVVGSKVAGRVIRLDVHEGQAVEPGQPIAEISSEQIIAAVDQAAAQKESARSTIESSRAIAAAAREQLARARAQQIAARAQRDKSARDATRAQQLFESRIISQENLDSAIESRDVAAANLDAAEKQVTTAESAVAAADAGVITALKNTSAAQAALEQHRATFGDTQIQAPISGVVSTKVAEAGEVVTAGAPIVIVTDLDALYMKAYVPEPEIGHIKLGDPAQVYVDAYPTRPFAATVREIAPRSEFTPKEVQTREERTRQIVAVKLYLDANPQHMLVPGMPADAAIRWKPNAPWVNPLAR